VNFITSKSFGVPEATPTPQKGARGKNKQVRGTQKGLGQFD
jgi:hypothetical protein